LNEVKETLIKTIDSINLENYKGFNINNINVNSNVKNKKHTGTPIECLNIDNTECLCISSDGICDCICIQKDDIGTLSNVNFDVDYDNPDYVIGQPIVIKKLEISYDYIGLLTTIAQNTELVINKKTYNLTPTSLYNVSLIKAAPIYLFNELKGTIEFALTPFDNEVESDLIRLRVVERSREFQVSNLKINAEGVIGESSFTATADMSSLVIPTTNVIPLSNIGISNMTFIYEVCWPKVILNEKFDVKLTLDNVIPTSSYTSPIIHGNPGRFMANIDIYFTANKIVNASDETGVASFSRIKK